MHDQKDVPVRNAEALVLGFTFKENCPDVRNSKVGDVIRYLGDYGINVTIYDPWARPDDVRREYAWKSVHPPDKKFDVVVLAVAHTDFLALDIPALTKELSSLFPKHFFATNGKSTYDYRAAHGVSKDHWLDAYCIACSVLPNDVCDSNINSRVPYELKQFRRHDRRSTA
mgnify:CR=1 FL=1